MTEFKIGNDKVCLSPVMDSYNREMLDGLLPDDATPLFHSDQGWQYQHAEYQRLLKEHNITQSMSGKGNCMDNEAMENFSGRLEVEMFYGEKLESVGEFIEEYGSIKCFSQIFSERMKILVSSMTVRRHGSRYLPNISCKDSACTPNSDVPRNFV